MESPVAYRAVKIADPRSRGACYWFEIEAIYPDGSRRFVAVCDTKQEARETIKALENNPPAKT